MKRPWTRRNEHSDLEQRLRDERPRPDEDLVRRVSQDTSGSGAPAPRFRLGVATGICGLALAGVIALGGLSAPVDTVAGIVQFDNAKSDKPANSQYEEKVTICHRPPGNPGNAQTLTLPQSGANNHLRNHPGDTLGPCPQQRAEGVLGVTEQGGGGSGGGGSGGAPGTENAVLGASDSGASLPFTGLQLLVIAALGLGLGVAGFRLRRSAA
jgi:hypothetical protein